MFVSGIMLLQRALRIDTIICRITVSLGILKRKGGDISTGFERWARIQGRVLKAGWDVCGVARGIDYCWPESLGLAGVHC